MISKVNNLSIPVTQKKLFQQLYYLFIFIFFTFFISFISQDVYAITGSYDSAFYSIRYTPIEACSQDPYGRMHTFSDFSKSSSWTSLDTPIDNDCQFLGLLYLHTRGSFVNGNTYTFRFTVDFYNNQDSQKFMINFGVYDILGSTTTDSTAASTENISSFTYRIVEGSNPNRMLIYVSFTPGKNLKYVGVRLVPKDLMPLSNSSLKVDADKLPYQTIVYTYLQITYEEGSNALIQNQTNVIQSQTDKLIGQFDNFINIFQNSNDELNDTITDDNIDSSQTEFDNFFSDFNTDTYGLTAVITAPLSFINSLVTSSCTPLVVPLPFVDTNLILPCMSSIYSQYFGSIFNLYQSITFGVISYWVVVRIFNLVKDFKNPEHDEIEVFDL